MRDFIASIFDPSLRPAHALASVPVAVAVASLRFFAGYSWIHAVATGLLSWLGGYALAYFLALRDFRRMKP